MSEAALKQEFSGDKLPASTFDLDDRASRLHSLTYRPYRSKVVRRFEKTADGVLVSGAGSLEHRWLVPSGVFDERFETLGADQCRQRGTVWLADLAEIDYPGIGDEHDDVALIRNGRESVVRASEYCIARNEDGTLSRVPSAMIGIELEAIE